MKREQKKWMPPNHEARLHFTSKEEGIDKSPLNVKKSESDVDDPQFLHCLSQDCNNSLWPNQRISYGWVGEVSHL